MIKLQNVSKYYASEDAVAIGVKKLNLELDLGEFVAVTGESGSGKTTFLNVISGIDTYEEGEITINSEETSGFVQSDWEKIRNEYISFVFQEYNIIDSYTVLQNVEIALLARFPDKKERRAQALALIEKVGLLSHVRHKGTKLSGGQKQRVVIARALAKDSPIIMADEPTGNLDSETGKEIIALLASMAKGRLVVVVTHNYEQIEPYATRKLRFFDGEIVEDCKIPHSQTSGDNQTTEAAQSVAVTSFSIETPEVSAEADVAPAEAEKTDKREKRKAAAKKRLKHAENVFRIASADVFAKPKTSIFLLALFICVTLILFFGASVFNMIDENVSGTSSSFFSNRYQGRYVVKTQNNTVFTDAEKAKLSEICGDNIIYEDIALDLNCYIRDDSSSDAYAGFNVYVMPLSAMDFSLDSGRAPQADSEIVIATTYNNYYLDELTNKTCGLFCSVSSYNDSKISQVTIVGSAKIKGVSGTYAAYAFVSDAVFNKTVLAACGKFVPYTYSTVTTYGETYSTDVCFVPDSSLPVGKAVVSYYNFSENSAVIKANVPISVGSAFFARTVTFDTVENVQSTTVNNTYVRVNDQWLYSLVYGDGYYQASVILSNNQAKAQVRKLTDAGFNVLSVNSDYNPDTTAALFVKIYKVCYSLAFVIICLVVFALSSAVCKRVILSKNRDYVVMRSIGIGKSTTDAVLVAELWLEAAAAFFLVGIPIWVIRALNPGTSLDYITPGISVLTFFATLAVSAFVALRYNSKMYGSSVVNSLKNK